MCYGIRRHTNADVNEQWCRWSRSDNAVVENRIDDAVPRLTKRFTGFDAIPSDRIDVQSCYRLSEAIVE